VSPLNSPHVVRFAAFELDLRSGELRHRGVRVRLQEKPFQVLALLVASPGELVTRQQLFEKVWSAYLPDDLDRSLAVAINKLRGVLNDNASNPRFIETVPRRGFRFIGQLVPVDPFERKSLLMVLPFENLSKTTAEEYFVDGLTEETISQLGRVNPQRLGVIARHTAMKYKGTSKTIAEIGTELNLDYLVLGRIGRAQNNVEISVELVQTKDQIQLWNQSFEQPIGEMPSVHVRVARQVAECLAVELLPQQRALIARMGTNNQQAYEMYLQGRHLWAARTDDAVRGAISFFEKAIAADGEYALAYTGMADCYNVLGYYGSLPIEETFSKAKTYATKALSINNHLAEAHSSLAFSVLQHEWNWSSAESAHQRALHLNSNCSSAHHWYGLDLTQVGRLQDARLALQRALALDPLSVAVLAHLARVSYFEQKYDDAADELRSVMHLEESYVPAKYFLALVLIQQGDCAAAVATLEAALKTDPTHPILLSTLAFAHTRQGRTRDAELICRELERVSRKRRVDPLFRAFALLDNPAQTNLMFDLFDQAYREHFGWLLYLPIDPAFDRLRTQSRFVTFLKKLNPPDESASAAAVC
jgi:TolB-like protein/Tfp pilus assembly protein PilF